MNAIGLGNRTTKIQRRTEMINKLYSILNGTENTFGYRWESYSQY